MSTPSFDPVQYKAGQRQLWDTVAPGWKKGWPTQEQAAQPVSDRLVAKAVTPAMAAGLTDHVWTMDELLSFRVPPKSLWL